MEVVQKHTESLFAAAEKVSHLAFHPEKFSFQDGPVKPDLASFSRENFSVRECNFAYLLKIQEAKEPNDYKHHFG